MTDPGFPRDPMTWRFNRRLEASCVRHCTKAVFTTRGALDMYAERYPELPASRWSIIENGYDEQNFTDAESGFVPHPLGRDGQITLIHSGALYPEERDPRPFFNALAALKRSGEILASGLQVILRATGCDQVYHPMLAELDIADIVQLAAPVGYREALREMLRADGLLLLQAAMCNHQIPAKLYEYLRAGKPILALTDPIGNTAEALRQAGAQQIADLADANRITEALRGFLARLRELGGGGVDHDRAARYSRRARAAELAHLLASIT